MNCLKASHETLLYYFPKSFFHVVSLSYPPGYKLYEHFAEQFPQMYFFKSFQFSFKAKQVIR